MMEDWNSWSDTSKKDHCETIVDIQYTADSWDIREFFDGEVLLWTHRECGT